MGVAVWFEDRARKREYLGSEISKSFQNLLARAGTEGQLKYVDPYGDTIFNELQVRDLIKEIGEIASREPALSADGEQVTVLLEHVQRRHGYLVLLGD
jgi:hypothetical protein